MCFIWNTLKIHEHDTDYRRKGCIFKHLPNFKYRTALEHNWDYSHNVMNWVDIMYMCSYWLCVFMYDIVNWIDTFNSAADNPHAFTSIQKYMKWDWKTYQGSLLSYLGGSNVVVLWYMWFSHHRFDDLFHATLWHI